MKKQNKLYRVDINLKYLVYTNKEYRQKDVLDWIKNDVHDGELDDACEISLVKDAKEIEDFTEMDIPYCPYYTNNKDESLYLSDIIDDLGLDANKMIERLKKLGYEVTKK